jgi:hypothetical protein
MHSTSAASCQRAPPAPPFCVPLLSKTLCSLYRFAGCAGSFSRYVTVQLTRLLSQTPVRENDEGARQPLFRIRQFHRRQSASTKQLSVRRLAVAENIIVSTYILLRQCERYSDCIAIHTDVKDIKDTAGSLLQRETTTCARSIKSYSHRFCRHCIFDGIFQTALAVSQSFEKRIFLELIAKFAFDISIDRRG